MSVRYCSLHFTLVIRYKLAYAWLLGAASFPHCWEWWRCDWSVWTTKWRKEFYQTVPCGWLAAVLKCYTCYWREYWRKNVGRLSCNPLFHKHWWYLWFPVTIDGLVTVTHVYNTTGQIRQGRQIYVPMQHISKINHSLYILLTMLHVTFAWKLSKPCLANFMYCHGYVYVQNYNKGPMAKKIQT